MKKAILFFGFLLVPHLVAVQASAKVKVVATLPVYASLAKDIGGERVETTNLARPNQDPHFLDAKPTFVVKLNQADLLLHNGLELEIGWLPPILVQARNPKIMPSTSGNVDLSQGLTILEIPQGKVDRSMGDVHPGGNPHIWLDPNNVKIMAVNIAEHLSDLDPAGKEYYRNRLKSFLQTMNQKLIQWNKEATGFKGKEIITYHKSLSYTANWLGIDVVATVEPKPGIPPSSKHVDDLLEKIPGLQVKAIVMEGFYPRKVPEYLSQKSGIPLIEIPVDVGEEGTKNYFDLIDHMLEKLKSVMR